LTFDRADNFLTSNLTSTSKKVEEDILYRISKLYSIPIGHSGVRQKFIVCIGRYLSYRKLELFRPTVNAALAIHPWYFFKVEI